MWLAPPPYHPAGGGQSWGFFHSAVRAGKLPLQRDSRGRSSATDPSHRTKAQSAGGGGGELATLCCPRVSALTTCICLDKIPTGSCCLYCRERRVGSYSKLAKLCCPLVSAGRACICFDKVPHTTAVVCTVRACLCACVRVRSNDDSSHGKQPCLFLLTRAKISLRTYKGREGARVGA